LYDTLLYCTLKVGATLPLTWCPSFAMLRVVALKRFHGPAFGRIAMLIWLLLNDAVISTPSGNKSGIQQTRPRSSVAR